ncbi:MAG: hypothetical protein LBK53_08485 [Heliobacteriaceae bacterium]|nr:hypothetical protein [Heliobacteriaceae bacterium]
MFFPLGEGAPDEGFIDNVIARSLHGKRRSNPVKTLNLPDCRVGLTRCNDAAREGE